MQMPWRWGGRGPFAAAMTAPTSEDERRFLQGEADILQSRLNDIRGRLDELETPKT
jgi:predicted  nucleic acid-binding Zn-ribbon protein